MGEADLWSLGVILFELVCGRLPFADNAEKMAVVMKAVLRNRLVIPPTVDARAQALIRALLVHEPKRRLGAGIGGYEEGKSSEFFHVEGGSALDNRTFFHALLKRELEPPLVPTGEDYNDPGFPSDTDMSDTDELDSSCLQVS